VLSLVDDPGFGDIEESEQAEGDDEGDETVIADEPTRDEHAGDFVDDDRGGILVARGSTSGFRCDETDHRQSEYGDGMWDGSYLEQ
jgi:hypothetical protein